MEWLVSIGCGRDSAGAEMVTFGKSSIDQIRMILGNEDLVRARVVGFVMVSIRPKNIFNTSLSVRNSHWNSKPF